MWPVGVPKLPPRLCKNEHCVQGEGGVRKEFVPRSTWQEFCCGYCRYHVYHYAKRKPDRHKAAEEKRAAEAQKEADALRAGEETPTLEHPQEPGPGAIPPSPGPA